MKFIYVLFLICLERESYIHDFPDFLVKIENGGVKVLRGRLRSGNEYL